MREDLAVELIKHCMGAKVQTTNTFGYTVHLPPTSNFEWLSKLGRILHEMQEGSCEKQLDSSEDLKPEKQLGSSK